MSWREKVKEPRLKWNGSVEAQKQADVAFNKARLHFNKGKKKNRQRITKKQIVVDYSKYLRSSWWKKRRAKAIEDAGNKCQNCSETKQLRVHHVSYLRLYRERRKDLLVLCERCHNYEHVLDKIAREHLASIGKEKK
jgi:hypothetical protein